MQVNVLLSPYDSGHYGLRMGSGPLHFQASGLEAMLTAAGHDVHLRAIEPDMTFPAEVKTAFELHRLVADAVRESPHAFSLLLAGNCNTSLGAIAGLGQPELGLIWFDAHGEYNTPETTTSGFLDGMGLSIITGRCWRALSAQVPGFEPLPVANAVLIGGRAFDAGEEQAFIETNFAVVRAATIYETGIQAELDPALDSLASRVREVYLHLDLDALDPAIAQANMFPEPDGLTVEHVEAAIKSVGRRFRIRGATIASYDAAFDPDLRTLNAGFRLMRAILKAASA